MFTGRWFGGTIVTSLPSMWMFPRVGTSKPASIRSRVVFPQPEGPSSEKNSPCSISKFASLTARTDPKSLNT